MDNKILAVVDGREITGVQLEMLKRTIGQERAAQFETEEGKKQLLDELINQELFYSLGIENKLDESEEFLKELEVAKNSIIKQISIRNFLNTIKVNEGEVAEYYEANKASFMKPEMVKASHILIDSEEKANEILAELKGDLSFEEAATKYSSCPSKEKGGDLGFFGKGQMVPEFEQAAFELDLDVLSAPVQTQFGFHIIKITEKMEEELASLEEMASRIEQQILTQKQNTSYYSKVEELKAKYNVEVK